MYFELDDRASLEEKEKKAFAAEIVAIALGPVPEGRKRAPHFAVAGALPTNSRNGVGLVYCLPLQIRTTLCAFYPRTPAVC